VLFVHILYHIVLAFSRWEHAEMVEGVESFEALDSRRGEAGDRPRRDDERAGDGSTPEAGRSSLRSKKVEQRAADVIRHDGRRYRTV
jgi:hypothetical protein